MKRTTTLVASLLLLVLASAPVRPEPPAPAGRLSFWDTPKRGANFFN
jgi:hypothetical protein